MAIFPNLGYNKYFQNLGERAFMADVTIRNLNFAYEKREILKDINLDIQKGEVVGLIGINGSRKVNIIKINDKNNISR